MKRMIISHDVDDKAVAPWRERVQGMVLDYGMKRDFNLWLASLGDAAPVESLTELREWNLAHRAAGSMSTSRRPWTARDALELEGDRATYEADRARDLRLNGEHPAPRSRRSQAPALRDELHGRGAQRAALLELAFAFEQATKRRVPPQGAVEAASLDVPVVPSC